MMKSNATYERNEHRRTQRNENAIGVTVELADGKTHRQRWNWNRRKR